MKRVAMIIGNIDEHHRRHYLRTSLKAYVCSRISLYCYGKQN